MRCIRFCGMRVELLLVVAREDWRLVAAVRDGMAAKGNLHLMVSVAAISQSTSRQTTSQPPAWSTCLQLDDSILITIRFFPPRAPRERALKRASIWPWVSRETGGLKYRFHARCSRNRINTTTACRLYRDLGMNGYRAESAFLHGRPYATGDSSLCISCSSA